MFDNSSNTTISYSYCFYNRTSLYSKIYIGSFTSMFIFIPTIVLCAAYLIIIRKLKELNKSFLHSNDEKAIGGHNFGKPTEMSVNTVYTKNKATKKKGKNTNSLNRLNAIRYKSQRPLVKSINHEMNEFSENKSSNSLLNYNCKKSPDSFRANRFMAKRKQTTTICLISLAFFFCQIPVRLFQIFNTFYEFESSNSDYDVYKFKILNIIFLSSKLLYYLHGMSNPIIYNLMSTKFSRSFKNVIFCKNYNEIIRYYFGRASSKTINKNESYG